MMMFTQGQAVLAGAGRMATEDVMEIRARIFAMLLGIVVSLLVINAVRTRRLKEEFALLWLLTAIVLVVTPLAIDYLDMVARALGVEYPPALIFLLAIVSLLLILFQFSLRISRFSDMIKVLTQEIAILSARLEDLEAPPDGSSSPGKAVVQDSGETCS